MAAEKELEVLDEALPSDPAERRKWILDARYKLLLRMTHNSDSQCLPLATVSGLLADPPNFQAQHFDHFSSLQDKSYLGQYGQYHILLESNPTSYLGGPRFKSQPEDQLFG
jgi:hypothetical protein